MKKKMSWILIFFMLSASFWQAASGKELSDYAPGQQQTGKEWRLTNRLVQTRRLDGRETSRYEGLPGRGSSVMGAGMRLARDLQLLLGLIVSCFLIFVGKSIYGKHSPSSQEPVRMRAVRYIHFAYGL